MSAKFITFPRNLPPAANMPVPEIMSFAIEAILSATVLSLLPAANIASAVEPVFLFTEERISFKVSSGFM